MDAERQRAQTRERVCAHRARETPAEAAERRRRNRERMRMRRRAAVPAVPVRQFDPRTLKPVPRRFRIDPRTLMPVYEDEDPLARARRIMGWP